MKEKRIKLRKQYWVVVDIRDGNPIIGTASGGPLLFLSRGSALNCKKTFHHIVKYLQPIKVCIGVPGTFTPDQK